MEGAGGVCGRPVMHSESVGVVVRRPGLCSLSVSRLSPLLSEQT